MSPCSFSRAVAAGGISPPFRVWFSTKISQFWSGILRKWLFFCYFVSGVPPPQHCYTAATRWRPTATRAPSPRASTASRERWRHQTASQLRQNIAVMKEKKLTELKITETDQTWHSKSCTHSVVQLLLFLLRLTLWRHDQRCSHCSHGSLTNARLVKHTIINYAFHLKRM